MKKSTTAFLGSLVVLLVCWGWILPWVNSCQDVRQYVERQRSAGINPSSLYYTEHPSAMAWEDSIRDRVDQNASLFWSLSEKTK
jgi:hypothetical protein